MMCRTTWWSGCLKVLRSQELNMIALADVCDRTVGSLKSARLAGRSCPGLSCCDCFCAAAASQTSSMPEALKSYAIMPYAIMPHALCCLSLPVMPGSFATVYMPAVGIRWPVVRQSCKRFDFNVQYFVMYVSRTLAIFYLPNPPRPLSLLRQGYANWEFGG